MTDCVNEPELLRFHAGEMSSPESSRVRKHLEHCSGCAQRNEQLRDRHQQIIHQVQNLEFGSALQTTTPPAEPTSSPAASPLTGVTIEGYDILRELQRGGQGVVYQAVQRSTKRKVAIKVLLAGLHASESSRRRFEREIELVAQLKHANIISILHAGQTPQGQQYYVMEYIRGLPLNRHVHEHRPGLEGVVRLLIKICDALQFAHHRGIIHRDLKPSNILVDAEGNPRLLDFGLARWTANPVDSVVSTSQAVIGTLPYMSPEQTRGNPDEIDARTDIYALGVMLYELLTGHYPYPVAGQMADVLKHIAETPPTPPSRVWTEESGVRQRPRSWHLRPRRCPIDDELQTVVLKTLAKERERRYQSAGELARDLERYLAGEAIEAKRDSGWYVLKRSVRRHRFGVLATAATIVLATTLGVYANNVHSARRAQQTVSELLGEGVKLKLLGRWSEAFAAFDRALHIQPHEPRALANQAIILKDEYFATDYGNEDISALQEAERLSRQAIDYGAALDTGPLAGIWNIRSVILYSLDQLEPAEEAARRALELKPDFHQAASNLGKILALQHRFDEARESLSRARLSMTMEDAGHYDDNVIRYFATLQLHLGEPGAVDSLMRAREVDRRDGRTRLMLARACLTLADHLDAERAEREADVALAISEQDDPRFHRILALACLRNGHYERAVTYAEAAREHGDLPAYGHLITAIAHQHLDNPDAARQQLEAGLAAWPPAFEGGEVIVQAKRGMLWFDTAQELNALRGEAQTLLAP